MSGLVTIISWESSIYGEANQAGVLRKPRRRSPITHRSFYLANCSMGISFVNQIPVKCNSRILSLFTYLLKYNLQ